MMASSVPSVEDRDPYVDRRVYPRVAVALPAFLEVEGERHSIHLLDLSAGGAKLSFPTVLPVGTTVGLDCGTLGRSAVVRWQNGDLVGLCFVTELDARQVSALIARSEALAARMQTRD
jgi:hypothetical protein